MSSSATGGKGGQGRLGRLLSGIAVAAGCVLFLGGFVWGGIEYQPYTVPTDSMQPTVNPGDRVLAQRVDGSEVRRGDIVVFEDPEWGNVPLVKRVIGVGGDKVACCDRQGRLTVNGQSLAEPFLKESGPASAMGFSARIPAGRLFMLGDNRPVSEDSRVHLTDGSDGAVPRGAVKGRVDAKLWPLSRMGEVSRPSSFAALPGGTSSPGPVAEIAASIVAGVVLIFGGAAHGPIAARRGRRRSRRGLPVEA